MSGIEPDLPYDVLDGELVPWETPTRRGEAAQALIDAMRAEHLRSLRPQRDKERDAERKRRRKRERAARRRNRRRR